MAILRLVEPRIFRMFEGDLRRNSKDGMVAVYYVIDNTDHSLKTLNQITNFIHNECPAVGEDDMEVTILGGERNSTYANHLCIIAKLQINDYLRLRNNSKIFVK